MGKTLNQGTGRACGGAAETFDDLYRREQAELACGGRFEESKGMTLGEVFDDEEKRKRFLGGGYSGLASSYAAEGSLDANEAREAASHLRRSDAMRHEQEMTALTVRLEVAEDQAEKLLAENRRLQSLVNENPQFEEMRRLKEENHRLTGALAEEQKQRGEIDRAIGGGEGTSCRTMRRSIDELLVAIGELREQAENQDDQPSLDVVALPKAEDLPAGYAFKVAAYVLDRAAELEE